MNNIFLIRDADGNPYEIAIINGAESKEELQDYIDRHCKDFDEWYTHHHDVVVVDVSGNFIPCVYKEDYVMECLKRDYYVTLLPWSNEDNLYMY